MSFQLSAQCGGEIDYGGTGLGGFSDENGASGYFRLDGEVRSIYLFYISLGINF